MPMWRTISKSDFQPQLSEEFVMPIWRTKSKSEFHPQSCGSTWSTQEVVMPMQITKSKCDFQPHLFVSTQSMRSCCQCGGPKESTDLHHWFIVVKLYNFCSFRAGPDPCVCHVFRLHFLRTAGGRHRHRQAQSRSQMELFLKFKLIL